MLFSKTSSETLYETDYLQWIETTIDRLRSRNYDDVDWDNLIEELEDMGKRDRRSLKNNLVVILLHLLKWQFQPDNRTGSWGGSIAEHRRRVLQLLDDSPSLKPDVDRVLVQCYDSARKQAHLETDLPLNLFPSICPYTAVEVLDDEFFPGSNL